MNEWFIILHTELPRYIILRPGWFPYYCTVYRV